jgi:dTDP-4-dehydrorhamnose 3,5-epimerase
VRFIETPLNGAYIIEIEAIEDERGSFARSWCQKEFVEHGLNSRIVQCNISFNKKRGTLRGMHFQVEPFAEAKLVRCTRGAIYDVIIDLRENSHSLKKWFAVELNESNQRMLYIPKGFAHGFQTLEDNTEVFYQMSEFYYPEYSRGLRWDDPFFSIKWPEGERIISKKDQEYPDFVP